MAATTLLRSVPLVRSLRLHPRPLSPAAGFLHRRLCEACTQSTRLDEAVSSSPAAEKVVEEPRRSRILDDPDYRKWKDKEEEILGDVGPTISLAKEILHSWRYLDGERLTAEDEETVVEKLLAHHPNADDKIGCGLDGIMVDRHPQFRQSRCLFVVRTDGGWIDFSYQKCLRAYIRAKYPTHAERFIRKHFKRGSG